MFSATSKNLEGRTLFALDRAGKTRESIAKEVGINLVSVYRILRTRKDAEKAPRRN
jgi:hypothetical protein